MHLQATNVDTMSITELEALHGANTKRPTQVPLSALRTAIKYFQAKDGIIRGDIVQSLCTSLSRAPEATLRDLEPLEVKLSAWGHSKGNHKGKDVEFNHYIVIASGVSEQHTLRVHSHHTSNGMTHLRMYDE